MIRERDHKDGTNMIRDEHTQKLDTRVALKSNVSRKDTVCLFTGEKHHLSGSRWSKYDVNDGLHTK